MKRIDTSMITGLISALLISGCTAPMIPRVEPASGIAIPADYFADSGRDLGPDTRPESGLDDVWWRGFGDSRLDALVDQALAQNQSLEASRQRLRSARALIIAEESDFLPTIDGQASAGAAISDGGIATRNVGASLGGRWTLDLNGRLSAERQAALANADGAAYFLADQRRLIAAAVANQYIELERTRARLQLLEQSTDLQQQTLRIVTLRFEAGLSANFDVRRAAADLARTEAQRGPLLLAQARAANAISVLVGAPPSPIGGAAESVAIPRYNRGPTIGVPADLMRRRPDLLIAEADVAFAAARVGIERADLAPSFSLPGIVSLGDGGARGLFAEVIASIAAALDIPLFDGGRRRAEVESAEGELQAELAEYRQTLLEILAEVESALVGIDAARDRESALVRSVTESEAAFQQSNALYREGLASLFDVLDVQRQLISSREALIDGEAASAQAHVALFSAVGDPM